jgi:uncharacterized protein YabE (DUF348 family)
MSILGLVICIGLLYTFILRKTIVLSIDDEKTYITTPALTVGGALRLERVSLTEKDSISPNLDQFLKDGDLIEIERASQIHIKADGRSHLFISAERSLTKLIASSGIPIYPDDEFIVNGLPYGHKSVLPYLPTNSIQVIRSTPISVALNGDQYNFKTTSNTLGQTLWNNDIQLMAKDSVKPTINTAIDKPITTDIRSSREIEIQLKDQKTIERTSANTIGEALSDTGYSLQGLDYSIPPEEAELPSDGKIEVVRVQEDVILETSPIDIETQYQPVSDLMIDQIKVIQSGETGLIALRIRVRYENEIEVERISEDEFIAKQPTARIIGYGTKLVPQTVNSLDGPIQYWRALDMYAVSYNPTSAGGSVTATGLPLQKGVAAVDPRYIPYGTRLYIPGYGEAVAADTGPGLTPRMIDLGYSDDDYVSWHQPVIVYFLWPPPENIVWIIP